MIYFASGVFSGWKHETFGGCFLDYAWLIQEELEQSAVSGGWVEPQRRRRVLRPRPAVELVVRCAALARAAAAARVALEVLPSGRMAGAAVARLRMALDVALEMRRVTAVARGAAVLRAAHDPAVTLTEVAAVLAWRRAHR